MPLTLPSLADQARVGLDNIFDVQQTQTGQPVDPLTGRNIDVSGLREGAATGAAQIARGFQLDVIQERRRQEALGTLQGLHDDPLFQQLGEFASESLENPSAFDEELIRLIFARGADGAATTHRANARAISSQIGGRGISASSPLAAGLAFQNNLNRAAQVRGVERDVTIEKLRQDTQDRALAFQQALGVAQLHQGVTRDIAAIQNQQVPTHGSDALEGVTELIIERHAQQQARRDSRRSNLLGTIGTVIGGIGAIFGGI